MKRMLVILNPISGCVARKKGLEDTLKSSLDNKKFEVQFYKTDYEGHAKELALNAVKEGVEYVVGVGGDGTLNEIASSLVGSETALGIIPMGSGNGLARHLHIHKDLSQVIGIINRERVSSIDYCTANGKPFFCTFGVGYDANVSMRFAQGNVRGKWGYLRAIVEEWREWKSFPYSIENQGKTIQGEAFMLICANASQWGNNAYIAPMADIQDGEMDICLLHPFPLWKVPQIAYRIFTKKIHKEKEFYTFRGKNILLTLPRESIAHYDGEPCRVASRVEIGICPLGLKVLV